jgi:hypothetical protein|tara:strand:- start:334 stop:564 length:231 start_codon:yes stop_codon:yes gene_type:complete
MSTNRDTIVVAGKSIPSDLKVESTEKVYNAQTGTEYQDDAEAESDVQNPATSTTKDDIKKDVAIKVNSLNIFGETT